ncbi:G2/mitotic-specific cyclin-2-like [Impatiens glandulifera]|uniref:G2/mitotic-specific cyclin-2-like n=1 Tax=Impatiens glandulifera TaxID=253017 RepID=UPI001FB103E9|nr:G2/mitotic-specific cyclin-2-like [Impatiens glandulifera]XP_047328507.1 G2/mitotic-specific cyclin-2-like [Impatiens glandulifera]
MVGINKENQHPGVIGPANLQGRKLVVPTVGTIRMPFRPVQNILINRDHPYPRVGTKRGSLPEKFSAQMACKKPIYKKENNTMELEEDVNMESDDFSAPMFVQHTEKMLEEIDRMVEVEMEDIDVEEEEPIIDIDIEDEKNPLAVVDYIDDLYTYYKKAEGSNLVASNYMDQQYDINDRMRGILIDWLIEVHYKFELMDETLYLTVSLIDRFLAIHHQLPRKKLQLVGVTALLIACKYEEVSVPIVDDLILISDKAFSREEILEMEKLMLNKLHFNMSVPTQYVFMTRFLKAAAASSSLFQKKNELEILSFYMIELCLVQYESLRFKSSLMAAAAVFTAQCALEGENLDWSRTCEMYTGYSKEDLLECSRMMVGLHEKAAAGKLTGVYRKYNTSKFGHIATKVEPAHFLLMA